MGAYAMAIRADHLALCHLLLDRMPRVTSADHDGDGCDLRASHVIPIEPASPLCPAAVRAPEGALECVILVLHLDAQPPRRREAVGAPRLGEALQLGDEAVTACAPWNALREFLAQSRDGDTQLDQSRDVADLHGSGEVIGIDGPDVPVAAVDTALLLPLVHHQLESTTGTA